MFRQAGVPPGHQDRVRGQQAADAGDLVSDGRQPQHGPRLLLDLQQQHQHHGHSGELIHGFYSFKTAFYVYCDNDGTLALTVWTWTCRTPGSCLIYIQSNSPIS